MGKENAIFKNIAEQFIDVASINYSLWHRNCLRNHYIAQMLYIK